MKSAKGILILVVVVVGGGGRDHEIYKNNFFIIFKVLTVQYFWFKKNSQIVGNLRVGRYIEFLKKFYIFEKNLLIIRT